MASANFSALMDEKARDVPGIPNPDSNCNALIMFKNPERRPRGRLNPGFSVSIIFTGCKI
jgi:hypothetical protein